ncbi:MAG: hypothetical protein ACJ74G_12485 [Blastocatellia bacterium]
MSCFLSLVSPAEGFVFLGYEFMPAGRVVPPPNIPEVVARRVIEFTDQTMKRFAGKAERQTVTDWSFVICPLSVISDRSRWAVIEKQ